MLLVDRVSMIADEIHELLDRHRPWLLRVIQARTTLASAVEDVYSEVLLAIAKSDHRPRDDSSLAPWLCKIAIRQSALANRTAMRRDRLNKDYAHQSPDSPAATDPIFWLMDQERRDLVRQVLHEMEPEVRGVLLAKFVEKLTYPQLAQRLGVAEHVVQYRVAQAKKRLRQMLTQRGIDQEDLS
ncbi:RNA polymerase sigma factor [Rosistilla oblonga]|uniref:RNA polymerase sigma factor n=2 Tax=Rosistilla oblonga TaxID=2527990 RepID=UPI003A982B7F